MKSSSSSEYRTHTIPTGFRGFFGLVTRTVFRSKGTAARFTPKRLLLVTLGLPAFLALQIVHRIAFLLDDLFFPGWKDVEVKEPLFIVGIHRSGTTFLHNLLSKDEDRFATFSLWELLFAPAVIERKCFMALGAIDRALGGFGCRALIALEDVVLKDLRTIHYTGLFQPEEDELVLLSIFTSAFLLLAFPFPDQLWALTRFDLDVPRHIQDRTMAFYKSCVQRHLYVHGPHKQFLSKNPQFSCKIDVINRTFPDSRIVCSVRNPYEAVPSLISLMTFSWENFSNDPQGDTLRDMLIEMAHHFYRHPMDRLAHWPRERHAFLRFPDLTSDPKKAVTRIYKRFGMAISPEFGATLDEHHRRARGYSSKHSYSLSQYGLSHNTLRKLFADVFARFDFNTDREAEEHPTRAA